MNTESFPTDHSRQHIREAQEAYIFAGSFSDTKNFGPVFLIALALSLLFQLFIVYFFPNAFSPDKSWLRISSPVLNVDIEFINRPAAKEVPSIESALDQSTGSLNGGPITSNASENNRTSASRPEANKIIDVSPNSISQAAANTLPEYTQNGSERVRIAPQYRRDPGAIETIRISNNVEIVRRGDTCFSVSEPEAKELMRGKVWSMPYFCGEPQSQKMMNNVQQDFCSRYGCNDN